MNKQFIILEKKEDVEDKVTYICIDINNKNGFAIYDNGAVLNKMTDLTYSDPKDAAETMIVSPLFGYIKGNTWGASKRYCFTSDGSAKECSSNNTGSIIFTRRGSSGLSASFIVEGRINEVGIAAAKKIIGISGGKTRRRTGRKGRTGRK